MSPEQDQCPENPDHLNEPTDELRMLNERLLQENEMLRSQINKFLIHPPLTECTSSTPPAVQCCQRTPYSF